MSTCSPNKPIARVLFQLLSTDKYYSNFQNAELYQYCLLETSPRRFGRRCRVLCQLCYACQAVCVGRYWSKQSGELGDIFYCFLNSVLTWKSFFCAWQSAMEVDAAHEQARKRTALASRHALGNLTNLLTQQIWGLMMSTRETLLHLLASDNIHWSRYHDVWRHKKQR